MGCSNLISKVDFECNNYSKNKTMQELQKKVIDWAKEKDILKPENADKQALKLIEEVGEVAGAYLKNDREGLKLELGDCLVVLIILSEQLDVHVERIPKQLTGKMYTYNTVLQSLILISNHLVEIKDIDKMSMTIMVERVYSICINEGFTPSECLSAAYNKIKNRTGKTVNGTFIKE